MDNRQQKGEKMRVGQESALVHAPDYAVPPGDTLQETLDALSMTQRELAERMGRPQKTINEIVKGKEAITPETALQLERVLGISASFWNNLERNFREDLARLEECKRLVQYVHWLQKFPVPAMVALGWLPDVEPGWKKLAVLLNFFGIAKPEQLGQVLSEPQLAYRKSPTFKGDAGARAAWLRKGVLLAQEMKCHPYNREKFLQSLAELRGLTTERDSRKFMPRVQELCASNGVAVVFVPELPRTCVSGVTLWLSSEKAMVLCSFRHKTNDHFWFTLFHEAGHIVIHGKKDVFYEGVGCEGELKEKEADAFACRLLIDEEQYLQFCRSDSFDKASIKQFSGAIGIDPAIVVGRLQHDERIPYSYHNDLKQLYKWDHE